MENFRSGVYTSFNINQIYSDYKNREIGLIAVCDKPDLINNHIVVNSLAKAKEVFGDASDENEVMCLLTAIFMNINTTVNIIPITSPDTQNYKNALDIILQKDPYILCFGNINNDFVDYLKLKLNEYEKLGKEKIAVISSSDIEDAKDKAKINDKRILVSFPKITLNDSDVNLSGAILSSLISEIQGITSNLSNCDILPDFRLTQNIDDNQISELLKAGVCVFENQTNIIKLIRAITTSTSDEEDNEDFTYRNLSTVLIIDTVIPAIREILKNKLLNANNNSITLNSVMALIISKLDYFVDINYISSYEKPNIYVGQDDESICFVELNFTIVQGVYQVYLNVEVNV